MSAEVLRQAAAKMRERAEAATAGPWQTYVDPHDDPIVFDQYGTGVQSSSTHDFICYSGQIYNRDATHFASWHPVVALAVAELLEGAAQRWDDGDLGPDEWDELTAVALAYLGEAS